MAITISGANNVDKILATDGVLDSISGFNVVGVMTAGTFDVTGKTTTGHLNIGSNIQIGNAGIITATTLIGNVTGNINHTSNLLLQVGGSEKFRVASSGQLGIGGANYGSAGQVLTSGGSGSAATWSTIATDKIIVGNTEVETVDTGSDGHVKIVTEGVERLRITPLGTVNLGDTDHLDDEYLSSTLKIQKDQNSVTRFTMRNENSGSGSAAAVQIGASGNSWMLQCGSNANDSNAFTIRVDGTANGNTGTEKFRIKTDGKVGVNTTGPSQQFTSYAASGYPVLANGPSNGIGLGGNGAIVFGTKDLGSYAPGILDASTLEFKISGSAKLNIDSSGRVGINRTPALASSKLEVGGADNYPLINVEASGATGGMGIGGGGLQFFYGTSEKFRIDSSGSLLIANTTGSRTNLSGNADDIVIGNTSTSNETGISIFSTSTSGIRFNDASGTDAAIEYSHSARELRFNSAGANRLQFGINASNSPVFSLGTGHYSGDSNNHNQGDRASVKVGAYLHLESALGAGHNSRAGLGYNCYFSSLENFNCGSRSPSGGDNRPAAYGIAYGNHYFYSDASNTAHSAQASLTMTKNMVIHRQGYVTTPQTPSFYATANSGGTVSMTSTHTLNNWRLSTSGKTYDIGSNFSTSNGRFTAPVAGKYLFTASILLAGYDQASGIHMMWRKNGTTMQYWYNTRTSDIDRSGYGGYLAQGSTTTFTLSANDYIEIACNFSGSLSLWCGDSNWGHFSGHLLG